MKEEGKLWNGFEDNKGKKKDFFQAGKGLEGMTTVSREDIPPPLQGAVLGRQ